MEQSLPPQIVRIQEILQDVEDLLDLRQAKDDHQNAPTLSIEEIRKRLGLDAA